MNTTKPPAVNWSTSRLTRG